MENLTDRSAAWRDELRKSMKNKERTEIARVKMNELDGEYRSHNSEEVNQGLTEEQALLEAKRCLDCPNPTCMQGCPVSINIPSFIKNIERGEFLAAAKVLKQTSALPAVCGRVCPQEKQCESQCIHLKMGHPAVAIGNNPTAVKTEYLPPTLSGITNVSYSSSILNFFKAPLSLSVITYVLFLASSKPYFDSKNDFF